jgi:hypothetical protein
MCHRQAKGILVCLSRIVNTSPTMLQQEHSRDCDTNSHVAKGCQLKEGEQAKTGPSQRQLLLQRKNLRKEIYPRGSPTHKKIQTSSMTCTHHSRWMQDARVELRGAAKPQAFRHNCGTPPSVHLCTWKLRAATNAHAMFFRQMWRRVV